MQESNKIFVYDENGIEKEMEILFTFEDDNKINYVVFQDPQAEDGEVFASIYDENGNLLPVETQEQWDMIEEVIGAFYEDEEEENA